MINSVVLMGRLTRTPECRSTENGTAVTAFRIAVDRRFTSSGGEKQTDFLILSPGVRPLCSLRIISTREI